ncbi:MAG TPA: hypothetical protein PLR76_01260 [Hyphomonas sp.]|nr:hypothetical protein [Hyphomonas sp.]MCA8904720.1 hypothetical protein [Hyphomonas sp.]MCB9970840.1 hypothetical protein [Hyphomonas sp.]HPE46985.1 hypothetical protein [Hyphomonas sp.]
MKNKTAMILACLALVGCASTEKTGGMTVAEGAQEECRTVTEMGSMLSKRVCHNKATWAAIDDQDEEEAKKTMGDVRSRRGYMDPKGGMGN